MTGDWIRRGGGRWGWRTVRDGRIRWCGKDYVVDDRNATLTTEEAAALPFMERPRHLVKYDGRLEGERLLFFTYGNVSQQSSAFIRSHVFLWGNDDWPGPNCVDGVFRFEAWRPISD